jgi:hypothetical protein
MSKTNKELAVELTIAMINNFRDVVDTKVTDDTLRDGNALNFDIARVLTSTYKALEALDKPQP